MTYVTYVTYVTYGSYGSSLSIESILGSKSLLADDGLLVGPAGSTAGLTLVGPGGHFITTYSTTPQGDYNGDGLVNTADYALWQQDFGSTTQLAADGNNDGTVNAADYTVWRDHYVAPSVSVPEPSTGLLLLSVMVGVASHRLRPSTASAAWR